MLAFRSLIDKIEIMKQKDFYFKKAKDEGYPARSVYKLKEMDEKYKIFKKGDRVLDLGCAPGSWMLYISQKIGDRGLVVGVDIEDLKIFSRKNIVFIKKDVFHLKPEDLNVDRRRSAAKGDPCLSAHASEVSIFDVVVSDLAPKTTGMKPVDEANSMLLADKALAIAKLTLEPKGNFVCKIFEGELSKEFFKEVKRNFKFVKIFRPKAVSKKSREIYVIGRGYLGIIDLSSRGREK